MKVRRKCKPQTLSHSRSSRRTSSDSNSPEFEFWMVRNPSCPQPYLLSADELFVDGVLLPLRLLPNPNSDPPKQNPPQPTSENPVHDRKPEPGPRPEMLSAAPALTASKRWTDIFKMGKTVKAADENDKEKEKRKDRKGGDRGASSAELKISIWPFSRSRSAGNGYSRPKAPFGAPALRKANSEPCSRSNSRKWSPASPGRVGVHLGRSSPVWQVRRRGPAVVKSSLEPQARSIEKGSKKEGTDSRRSKSAAGGGDGGKARVLNLNVRKFIEYRSHLSCRSDESSAVGVRVGGGSGEKERCADGAGESGLGGNGNGGGEG